MMGDILKELLHLLPGTLYDVAVAFLPIVAVFVVYQLVFLKLPKSQVFKMFIGVAYSYVGLVLFFMGLDIGFTETGTFLGDAMGAMEGNWILIPIGLLIGFSVVLIEPAVASLVRQVESVTGGMIHRMAIYVSLCIGVALSVALSMMRAIWNINLWYFIIPGYLIALVLAKFTPPMFTAIAFDSGGVASGPMTATFVLSFTVAVTAAVNETASLADSFGVVCMVAMTPLITIQILGLIYQRKSRLAEEALAVESEEELSLLDEEQDTASALDEDGDSASALDQEQDTVSVLNETKDTVSVIDKEMREQDD